MLRDYRNWLDSEVRRLYAEDRSSADARLAEQALERFEAALGNRLCVEFERPLARRILTAIELLEQQSTASRPELEELRAAIKLAFEESILPFADEAEPLEREFF
jgi:hypothetical protein